MVDLTDDLLNIGKRKCVRYANEGGRVIEQREHEVVGMWERFNRDFRPDSALFVDGTCIHRGAFTKEQCMEIEAGLKTAPLDAGDRSEKDLLSAVQ